MDIRAKDGAGYISPSYYFVEHEKKEYKWLKGNLSKAKIINDDLLNCLQYKNIINNTENFKIEPFTDDNGKRIVK